VIKLIFAFPNFAIAPKNKVLRCVNNMNHYCDNRFLLLDITQFCHALSIFKMYAVLEIITVRRLSDSDNCSQLGFFS